MIKNCRLCLLFCALSIMLCACFHAKPMTQKTYMLTVPNHAAKTTINLSIAPVSVLSPFNHNAFIYRISKNEYKTDYYNAFLISPAEQFHQIFSRYFQNTRDSYSKKYQLKITVIELYADYQDSAKPKAQLTLSCRLFRKHRKIWEKTFSQSTPLKAKNTKALINAWNEDLQQILSQIKTALTPIDNLKSAARANDQSVA